MLNKTEGAYFDSLCWEKINPLRERHFAEIDKINATPSQGRSPAPLTREIRRFKRDLAQARIEAFIETYQRLGRYPNEIDFEDFAQELIKIVDRKDDNFPQRFKRGLFSYPAQVINGIEEQLSNEIRQDVGIALQKLAHFINEGKLFAAQQAVIEQQMNSSAHNEHFMEFQEYLGKQIDTLSDLDWEATSAFLKRIPTDLERVDFLKNLSNLPDDGVVNNIAVNPAVHRRNHDAFLTPLNKECTSLLSRQFNLETVLQRAEQITEHGNAIAYLWKALRAYAKYYPSIRSGSYSPEQLVFYKTVEKEIQFRKDLQESSPRETTMIKDNVFNLDGEYSRINIASQDNSINLSQKTDEKVFAEMKQVIQSDIKDEEERTLILNKLSALEEAGERGSFLERYQEFITSAANHMTLLAPFIPALTEMLRSHS